MKNRREFCQSMLGTAIGAAALTTQPTLMAGETQGAAPQARRGKPLLELQQRFIDLRFGMFVHFNMATFQDREWGDPTSPLTCFIPPLSTRINGPQRRSRPT